MSTHLGPDTQPPARGRLAALALALALVVLGGWAIVLLAQSRRPPPPLPFYALPKATAGEPLPPKPTEGLAERQVLVYNNGVEPETLDPGLMKGVAEHTLAAALFEGLTSLHPKTLEPVPGIARSWDVSEDGRTYVFHLRPSQWSTGEPLTAHDFAWSWRRTLSPETASEYAYMLHGVLNAKAFSEGGIEDPRKVGVRAVDDLTLEVTLEHPLPYFLELTAFATSYPVHQGCITRHGDKWTEPGHMVSNGPFVLAEWSRKQRIVMKRNPRYWDAERVVLQEIRALAIDDSETALKMYQNREVDWIRDLPAIKVADAARQPGFHACPSLGTYFYRFNVTREPLDDVRVRKALALAIDKTAIATWLLRAGQRPARSYVPPVLLDYQAHEGPRHDPDLARQLLAQAGYPGGKGFPKLEILYNTSDAHKQIAETIQYMWRTELGVRVTLRNQEWKVYLDSTSRLNYDIARAAWIGDYNDPTTFLNMFVTGGGHNRTGWSHKRYDQCIRLATAEPDRAKRQDLLQEAERILVADEMPISPIYFYVYNYLVRPRVKGVYANFRNVHPFQYMYIAAD